MEQESRIGAVSNLLRTLAPGVKSSEFIGIMAYFVWMVLSSLGVTSAPKTEKIEMLKKGFELTVPIATDGIQSIMATIKALAGQFGDQTLVGTLLWFYLRHRFNLKKEDLELGKLDKQALIEKYKAIVALKGKPS